MTALEANSRGHLVQPLKLRQGQLQPVAQDQVQMAF